MTVTQRLATFCTESRYDRLPAEVYREGVRSFVNWFGCALGGCNNPGIQRTYDVLDRFSGPRVATFFGRPRRIDIFAAAFLNGMANSLRGYNDTHLKTVAHPAAPVGAALLAMAERDRVHGQDLIHALILGIEIQCRVGNILVTPPARSHFGLSMVGIAGGIGAAVAVAKLQGLDARQTNRALGIAAGQAGGLRETHGTLASHMLTGEAARAGMLSALLAAEGFTCSEEMIEGPKGYAQVYAQDADPEVAVDELGEKYETLNNTYKPYPCGIVIHPIIDVCLDLARAHELVAEDIERVVLTVNPLAVQLTGRKEPENGLRAGSSLYHWAAASLIHRKAGLNEGEDTCVHDPVVVGLRRRVEAHPDPAVAPDAARAVIHLRDGRHVSGAVSHARGSADRPMTDHDLSQKFVDQAQRVMGAAAAASLLEQLWQVEKQDDVGALVRHHFPADP
jgi:2-methylcitrate dehydratase PrpD